MQNIKVKNKSNQCSVIDFSGYSFSGKSAYFDLFCEFEGYKYFSKEFEFELLRAPYGIITLYNCLVEDWSPIRSSEAIRSFKNIIKIYGGGNSLVSRLQSHGYNYDYYFPGFTKSSIEFIESLTLAKWNAEWPFAFNNHSSYKIFIKKLLYRLGRKKMFETDIYLSRFEHEEFLSIVQKYFCDLFKNLLVNEKHTLLLNNAFETTNPQKSQQFFSNAKSIIVDRDPRDIYLSAKSTGIINGLNVGNSAIGDGVENFISRFKLYRNNFINNENTLRINFENLVLDYENTLDKIFIFLNENRSIHKYPKKYFDPEISKKGVGMWKNVDGQLKKDIDKIYLELKDYCLDI
ncbi:hypothetical protein KKG81_10120 [bacterium]|nr:hypothetical protein [bacterium]